jgi:hypothetical protein
MSKDLEDRLRGALRPVDPGDGFAHRVMARVVEDSSRSSRSRPPLRSQPRFRWLAAAAGLACVAVGVLALHALQARRTQQGLEARAQLIEALRVTGEKLDLAYRAVNDEQPAAGGPDSGA